METAGRNDVTARSCDTDSLVEQSRLRASEPDQSTSLMEARDATRPEGLPFTLGSPMGSALAGDSQGHPTGASGSGDIHTHTHRAKLTE